MKLGSYGKQLEKFLQDNSPTILSVIGVIGTVTTAILTGRATFKAAELIHDEDVILRTKQEDLLDSKGKVLLVWKEYIPPVASGAVTVAAIIGANRISVRRAAALAAAYSLAEGRISEYREKMQEKLGITKEQQARAEIAQAEVNRNPVINQTVILTGNGEVLCYDQQAGRYFKSNMEKLRRVQNDINSEVLGNGYSTLRDFYTYLELPETPYCDEVGWTQDELLELQFSTVLTDDNTPCLAFEYNYVPIRGYK